MNLSYMSTYALAECSEKEIEKCRKTKLALNYSTNIAVTLDLL